MCVWQNVVVYGLYGGMAYRGCVFCMFCMFCALCILDESVSLVRAVCFLGEAYALFRGVVWHGANLAVGSM